MTKKLNSEEMLQRLVDKGFPVDLDALNAPFSLTITSVASIDVDAEPIIKFSQRVKEVIHETAFKCELASIVVFPTVLNPEIKSTGDTMTWRKSERAYVVRRNIDFLSWLNANSNTKKELLAKCVIDSIANIPNKHLSEATKEVLIKIVLQAIRSRKKLRVTTGA